MLPRSIIARCLPCNHAVCSVTRLPRPLPSAAVVSANADAHHYLPLCNQKYIIVSRTFRNSVASGATERKKENKNKSSTSSAPKDNININASSGRIAWRGEVPRKNAKSGTSMPRLCSGCGVEILAGSSGSGTMGMAAGQDVINNSMYTKHRTKKQQKMARYASIETPRDNSLLCQRCESLQDGNIWKAYDALKDVDADVFSSQLSHIVNRRKFGLCIVVVDATDVEFSSVRKLRDVGGIRGTPCILAINKVDLLPRDMADVHSNSSQGDLKYMRSRVESGKVKMIDAYGVSAATGRGMVDLAEGVLRALGGRDVFVVGAANVGKSTLVKSLSSLLVRTLRMKGRNKNADDRRRDTLQKLRVTASHLPGTTLQAVRIPCFPSTRHALWDTPGIINKSAVAYSLFPSHLMEPLAFPKPIHIPSERDGTRVRVKGGHSILIEAGWVHDDDDDVLLVDGEEQRSSRDGDIEQFTLARLDIVKTHGRMLVEALAFIPSCLKIRVVPTELAPEIASIPREYIAKVQSLVGQAGNFDDDEKTISKPLAVFKGDGSGVMKDGTVQFDQAIDSRRSRSMGEWIRNDIVFASLGWIMLNHRGPFTIRPWCVKGSLWSKRRPLYPSNLEHLEKDDLKKKYDGKDNDDDDDDDACNFANMDDNDPIFQKVKKRLQHAADEGRHRADAEGKHKRAQTGTNDLDDDEAWWSTY